jgi:protocatechuate 3,4-dioxygenase beta subunit
MRPVPVKLAATSLAAGLLAALIPAGQAGAAGPAHKILLRNGEFTYTTRAPVRAKVHAEARTPRRPVLARDGRLLARPATTVPDASKGSISGRVTGDGHPVRGICVVAYGPGSNLSFVKTSRTGRYRLPGLRPGRYYVAFVANDRPCVNEGNWLLQWYRQVDSLYPESNAVRVPVRAGRDTPGINASLHHGGQITGVVHDQSGRALAGICVLAGTFEQTAQARTNAQGHYAIGGLYPNTFNVVFYAGCGTKGNYEPRWWPNTTARHTKAVKVVGHKITSGIDAIMLPGAEVTGTVGAQAAGHRPLSGVCVYGYSDSGAFTLFGPPGPSTTTTATGHFELKGLTTGRATVLADPRCRGSKAKRYLSASRNLSVQVGTVRRGVRLLLQASSGAAGRVTDPQGRPIKGVCVIFGDTEKRTRTGSDGRYQVLGLHPRKTLVQFTGGCGNSASVVSQFYRDGAPVSFRPGKITTGINAVMQPGTSVVGTVTDLSGHPLRNQCVLLMPVQDAGFLDFSVGKDATTNDAGRYEFRNLPPGPYQVTAGCGRYAFSWFRSAPDSTLASSVSTLPGVTTTVSFKLGRPGSISGTVTDPAGHPLSRICAFAADPKTRQLVNVGVNPAVTGPKGQYRLRFLTPGQYLMAFTDCHSHPRLGTQWYKNGITAASATPVTVRAGQRTTRIDATLRTGATISGTVTGPGGKPVSRICVQAIDPAGISFRQARTDSQGRYSIPGLGTGRYPLNFAPCGTAAPNLGSISIPGQVQVTAPRTSTINVRLKPGGSISGTVLGGSHGTRPLDYACILAVPDNPDNSRQVANADLKGRYLLRGLAPGTYRIYFSDVFCPFFDDEAPPPGAPQWFRAQPTQSTATLVTVSAGHLTKGIDAKLVPAGTISGRVTDTAPAGLGRECVTAVPFHAKPDPFFNQPIMPEVAITSPTGHFTLSGLFPGQYKVKFSSGCGRSGYAGQWWDDATSQQTATVIRLAFTDIGGINARLNRR